VHSPYPHPHPSVCRASTGFGWTVTAYTAVLSSAGMAQGFAGPARLIPYALGVATGKVLVSLLCVCGGGAVLLQSPATASLCASVCVYTASGDQALLLSRKCQLLQPAIRKNREEEC